MAKKNGLKSILDELYTSYDRTSSGRQSETIEDNGLFGKSLKKKSFLSINHTRTYERHFEDYNEYRETDENGREVLRRVYSGDYYSADLSEGRYFIVKLAYALSFIIAVALLVLAGIQRVSFNRAVYMTVGQVTIILGFIWMLMGLFNYFTVSHVHTVGDHKASSERIKNSSILLIIAFGYTAVAAIIAALATGQLNSNSVVIVLEYLGGLVISLALFFIEKHIRYIKTPAKDMES